MAHPENAVIFPDRARVREILVYYPERDDYSINRPDGFTALHVERRPGERTGQQFGPQCRVGRV